jgi:hypothetical protein
MGPFRLNDRLTVLSVEVVDIIPQTAGVIQIFQLSPDSELLLLFPGAGDQLELLALLQPLKLSEQRRRKFLLLIVIEIIFVHGGVSSKRAGGLLEIRPPAEFKVAPPTGAD